MNDKWNISNQQIKNGLFNVYFFNKFHIVYTSLYKTKFQMDSMCNIKNKTIKVIEESR